MAKDYTLDFERPIADLEKRLDEIRRFGLEHDLPVEEGVQELEKQIEKKKEQIYSNLTPYQRVLLARHVDRPHAKDYIDEIFDDFLELHGDRRFGDDGAMIGGMARFGNRKVMVIGQQKGRDLKENIRRNFGVCHPEGYRKAVRLMALADKAQAPIICLIDTKGAAPDIGSEERHVGEAIAVNLREMFRFRVPIVAVVIGEGGSGGALGIGVANRVLMMENAYYSVITPEGCAAILWKTSNDETNTAAAESLKLTSENLLELGIADEVIPEPQGGANRDFEVAAESLRNALDRQLHELCALDAETLKQQRYEKYRKIGVFTERPPKTEVGGS